MAYPPSRYRFARRLATVLIRHRRTRRGAFVCNTSNDGDGRLGRGHGRSRRDRFRPRLIYGPTGDADCDATGFDRRMGRRESAMVLAFSYAGLAESDGLIVSILFGVGNLVVGAIGGIVWVASGYRWRSVKKIATDTLAHDPSH